MTRYLVTFDDGVHEGETSKEAVERAVDEDSLPNGATVFAVDLDAALDGGLLERYRIGAEKIPLAEVIDGK